MHPGSPSYGQPPQGGASAPPSYPHHPPPQHPSSPQANAYYPPHQQSQFPPGPYGSYPPPAGGAPVPPGQLQYPTYNNQQGHGASPPNQTQYPGYPPQQPSGYQTSLQQQHPPSPPYVYQQPPSPPQAYQQPPVYQQQQPPPATLGYSLPPPPPAQAQAQVQGQVPPAPQAVVVPHGLVPNNNLIQNGPIGGYQPLNAGGAIISTVPAPISHESNVLNTTLAGGGGVDPRLTGVAPPSVVEIHFKCVNLKKSDLFSKSDPFLVIYLQESRLQPMQQLQNGWREIGRTETIKNSQDPIFSKSFQFEYFFEQVQRLRIEVFDRDSDSEQLKDHDFLGMIEITLGQLMGAKGQSMVLALLNAFGKKNNINGEGKCGHIVLSAEEMSSCSQMIGIKFSGNKLDNKNSLFGEKAPSFLGASDPFLNIYKKSTINHQQNQMDWILVWRSNVQMNTLNPRWKEVILPIQLLCNGDTTRPLKIECMDWEKNGQHQLIGSIETTVQDLRQGKKTKKKKI
jgi:hypothetical protein